MFLVRETTGDIAGDDTFSADGAGLFRYKTSSLAGETCSTFRHVSSVVKGLNDRNDGRDVNDLGLISSAHRVAQAGSILATLFGFTCTLLLFLSFFFQRMLSKIVWRIVLPTFFFIAAITQSTTFAFFGADQCKGECVAVEAGGEEFCDIVTCTFAEGANKALAAMMLYFFMGVAIIFYPKRMTPLIELGKDDNDYEHIASSHAVAVNSGDGNGSTSLVVLDHKRNDMEMAEQYLYDKTEMDRPAPDTSTAVVSGLPQMNYSFPPDTTPIQTPMKNATAYHYEVETPMTTAVELEPETPVIEETPVIKASNHFSPSYPKDEFTPIAAETDRSASTRVTGNHRLDDPMVDHSAESSTMNEFSSSSAMVDNSGSSAPRSDLGAPYKPRKHTRKTKRATKPRREDPKSAVSKPRPSRSSRESSSRRVDGGVPQPPMHSDVMGGVTRQTDE